jgi:hypothetical protein
MVGLVMPCSHADHVPVSLIASLVDLWIIYLHFINVVLPCVNTCVSECLGGARQDHHGGPGSECRSLRGSSLEAVPDHGKQHVSPRHRC